MRVNPSASSRDVDGPSIRINWSEGGTLVATWQLSEEVKSELKRRFALPPHELPFVLRLYDVTDRDVRNDGLDKYVDFEVNGQALEWRLYGIEPGRNYRVDLGVRLLDGRFWPLIRSEVV